MNKEQIDLIVSILNLIIEKADYNVSEEGFGYNPNTLEIDAIESDLTESLS